MSTEAGFLHTHKHAIVWTICYFVVVWAILQYMFNFSIFSARQWDLILHARLVGFPGFVFSILLLAAIPLYIATTSIIVRTKRPLLPIPVPRFLSWIVTTIMAGPTPDSDNAPAPVDDDTTTPPPTDNTPTIQMVATPPAPTIADGVPPDVPAELRVAFTRARANVHSLHVPKTNIAAVPVPVPTAPTPDEMPLPSDFDFSPTTNAVSDAPVFTDINFDTPDASSDTNNNKYGMDDVIKHLGGMGRDAKIDGDIIISGHDAIATHVDNAFWVADTDVWFAAGAMRPSPVAALLRVAADGGLRPILYLGATNIMDIDNLRTKWEHDGITIVTSIDEIK